MGITKGYLFMLCVHLYILLPFYIRIFEPTSTFLHYQSTV